MGFGPNKITKSNLSNPINSTQFRYSHPLRQSINTPIYFPPPKLQTTTPLVSSSSTHPTSVPSPSTMNIPSTKTLTPLKHREDCWSEEDSYTLVEAWGDRYIELNRGNLRQNHWQQVADTVNSYRKIPRTDIQCKNRIDTLKKRYKLERSKILDSNGKLSSNWPLYNRLHSLIGDFTTSKGGKKLRKCLKRREFVGSPLPTLQKGLEVMIYGDDFCARRFGEVGSSEGREGDGEEVDGMRELAKAVMRFGEVYERVEGEKQLQMIELEKQRMEVTKSMEFERMQFFMDTLVQVEKIKRRKRASAAASDNYN